jgi:hypothetical protein
MQQFWDSVENVEHIHNGTNILAMKKNEIMLFAGKWMELEIILLSEVSQALKDKGHVFLHMWKLDL